MTRERDYAFEALAEVTNCDVNASRGELNVALKSIREQSEISDSYLLADEIHTQARRYRDVMGDDILLTPTALAKHWKRVEAEVARAPRSTNQSAVSHDDCSTCQGDRFVVVSTRAPVQSEWMRQREISASKDASLEEYAPCPDCNPTRVTMRRYDSTIVTTPDAAQTREWMRK